MDDLFDASRAAREALQSASKGDVFRDVKLGQEVRWEIPHPRHSWPAPCLILVTIGQGLFTSGAIRSTTPLYN